MFKHLNSKILGAILLIAGTQIGAGMLALPITTGVAGFIPAMALFMLAFFYMLSNLFILLEANLACPIPEANIISIAQQYLGRSGQSIAWVSFLLLLYSASAAYLVGGANLLASELKPIINLSSHMSVYLFAAMFAGIAYFGIVWIDRINRLLMLGLIIAYTLSTTTVLPEVKIEHLLTEHIQYIWAAIPVVILSFTSHIVIPSITHYLKRDIQSIHQALWIGSLIPLIFYILWEIALVGTIPSTGPQGLHHIATSSTPLSALTEVLTQMKLPFVANSNLFFSIFAIATSFLGVILSLCDFLADGLNIQKNIQGRLYLLIMSFAPPLLFAQLYPHSFILALGYAGVFVAILYGILPSLIVLRSRHAKQDKSYTCSVPTPLLWLCIVLACSVIVFQILATAHWLPTP
tara:strand:+ start:521 stop:1738 length:1218 start_codon:yes stop_codon:yes gene_type:complete